MIIQLFKRLLGFGKLESHFADAVRIVADDKLYAGINNFTQYCIVRKEVVAFTKAFRAELGRGFVHGKAF